MERRGGAGRYVEQRLGRCRAELETMSGGAEWLLHGLQLQCIDLSQQNAGCRVTDCRPGLLMYVCSLGCS